MRSLEGEQTGRSGADEVAGAVGGGVGAGVELEVEEHGEVWQEINCLRQSGKLA